jgi:hypothetical protein
MNDYVVRFETDHHAVAVATEKIQRIDKVNDDYCEVFMENGDRFYIKEQLNVAEARWTLALSAIAAIKNTGGIKDGS